MQGDAVDIALHVVKESQRGRGTRISSPNRKKQDKPRRREQEIRSPGCQERNQKAVRSQLFEYAKYSPVQNRDRDAGGNASDGNAAFLYLRTVRIWNVPS